MGIFSSYRHPLNEAEVDDGTTNNNQQPNQDDEDYTAGADTAADDESNDPATDNDAGGDDDVDYTDGADEAGDDESNDDETGEEGQDDQDNPEGDDVDYTDGADGAADDESNDSGDDADADSEGSDDGDVDYTDGADDGGDGESGDDNDTGEEGEDSEDTEGEEGEDNTYEDLRKIEAELFSNLSPEQIDIKNKELKQRFIDIYGTISSVILRINDIPKTDTNVDILHFVTDKLMELKDLVDFTVQKSFDTKTYIENSINYQICLSTLDSISDIIASAQLAEDNPTEEEQEDQDGVVVGDFDDSDVNPGDSVVAYGDKMVESADSGRFNTFL
jgi:hypothetical protein